MPLRFADPTTSPPCLLLRPHSAIKRIFSARSEADLWVHGLVTFEKKEAGKLVQHPYTMANDGISS